MSANVPRPKEYAMREEDHLRELMVLAKRMDESSHAAYASLREEFSNWATRQIINAGMSRLKIRDMDQLTAVADGQIWPAEAYWAHGVHVVNQGHAMMPIDVDSPDWPASKDLRAARAIAQTKFRKYHLQDVKTLIHRKVLGQDELRFSERLACQVVQFAGSHGLDLAARGLDDGSVVMSRFRSVCCDGSGNPKVIYASVLRAFLGLEPDGKASPEDDLVLYSTLDWVRQAVPSVIEVDGTGLGDNELSSLGSQVSDTVAEVMRDLLLEPRRVLVQWLRDRGRACLVPSRGSGDRPGARLRVNPAYRSDDDPVGFGLTADQVRVILESWLWFQSMREQSGGDFTPAWEEDFWEAPLIPGFTPAESALLRRGMNLLGGALYCLGAVGPKDALVNAARAHAAIRFADAVYPPRGPGRRRGGEVPGDEDILKGVAAFGYRVAGQERLPQNRPMGTLAGVLEFTEHGARANRALVDALLIGTDLADRLHSDASLGDVPLSEYLHLVETRVARRLGRVSPDCVLDDHCEVQIIDTEGGDGHE